MRERLNIDGDGRAPGTGTERFETVVVGAGQAGLSVGYHLARRSRRFVVLDAGERVGDSWRARWDSLRLFTPARYDSLPGWAFPASAWTFPTKDEMGDYLQAYAERFELPVRSGVKVERLTRRGDRWLVEADGLCIEADNVVIASGAYQDPHVPEFAEGLAPGIVQLHSSSYRNPSQLQPGPVLVVGAGNSGADIALDVAGGHRTWMAGRDVGHLPFRVSGRPARLGLVRIALRVVFHRLLTLDTPVGRKLRPALTSRGGPLIRIRQGDLVAAGVERTPRMVGTEGGLPLLEDGRVLEVANLVWCTGFRHDLAWAGLPEHGGEAARLGRVVAGRPGLYLVGQHFLHALSSAMIHGVERDAAFVADTIAARAGAARARARRADDAKFAGGTDADGGRWTEPPHGEPAWQGDGALQDPADRQRSAWSSQPRSSSRS